MLDLKRKNLESNCLKISKNKTKYIECNIGGLDDSERNPVKIGNDLVSHCEKFRYLDSMVESQWGFDLDITNTIRAESAKCR